MASIVKHGSRRFGLRSCLAVAVTVLGILAPVRRAAACPLVAGLVDFNCDGKYKAAFIGDSIVYGIGDQRHKNKGGYPLRLQLNHPDIEVVNAGVPGISSGKLLSLLTREVSPLSTSVRKGTRLKRKLDDADLLVIGVGINDYFEEANAPLTVRNIKRIVSLVRTALGRELGAAPLVAVAYLTPTRRRFQQPFVDQVNELLTEYKNPSTLPVYLDFTTLDPALLRYDNLHPTSAGYEVMGQIFETFFVGKGEQLATLSRPDGDGDGIYDRFESRFRCNARNADSDGDGLLDGEEVFIYKTDPRLRDTDGDGIEDKDDVVLIETPTPTPTGTPGASSSGA